MGETADDAWTSVWCLRHYHPYHRRNNPDFNDMDRRLLDMKIDGKAYAITAEAGEIAKALASLDMPEPITVAIIPGHKAKPSNAGTPLARVAAALGAKDKRLKVKVDLLIRTKDIDKLATGGNRSIDVHLGSMKVTGHIAGGTVLLLDDIVTSGNSMAAGRQLLMAAGAEHVAGVALGQTV